MADTAEYHSCPTLKNYTGNMIERRRDYVKSEPCRDAHKLYIICEGKETEPNYFDFFKGLSSNLEVIPIKPENGTDPTKLMELSEAIFFGDTPRYKLDYSQKDTIWFAIDTDTWEEEGKVDVLKEYCFKRNKSLEGNDSVVPYPAWNIAQSNPCFEIWLYYHFYDSVPEQRLVDEKESFKQFVNDSIHGGFNNEVHPVYIVDAITNAERLYSEDSERKVALYSTQQFLLGKEILGFTQKAITSLRRKMQ